MAKTMRSTTFTPTTWVASRPSPTSLATPYELVDSSRYLPFGGMRVEPDEDLTDRGYTDHRHALDIKLIDMRARWQDPAIGRFLSPDTIIPDPADPQCWNRYSYVNNRPTIAVDPSGHRLMVGRPDDDPVPVPPPVRRINPWLHTPDMNHDGQITEDDDILAAMSAEDILLDHLSMPADSGFGTFGGPRTTQCLVVDCNATRHPAVDSRRPQSRGDPIYAVAYGRVVGSGDAGAGFGRFVIVEHIVYGIRFYSVYAHNTEITAQDGRLVTAGTQIATMGDTGTESVHLHFEIRRSTNVDLDARHPFIGRVYWPSTARQLKACFVDLGPVFGYDGTFDDWIQDNP